MKLYHLEDEKDLQTVSERMWEIVQKHKPGLKGPMVDVINDERLDRADLVHAGFVMGAAFALAEMMQGHIVEAGRG